MAGGRVVEPSRIEELAAGSIQLVSDGFWSQVGVRLLSGKFCGDGSTKHVATFRRHDRLSCDLLLWL